MHALSFPSRNRCHKAQAGFMPPCTPPPLHWYQRLAPRPATICAGSFEWRITSHRRNYATVHPR